MKYRTTDIKELFKRVLNKTNTAVEPEEWESLTSLISSYGSTIDRKSLQEFGNHLIGDFEILRYTLNEMIRIQNASEEVVLTDKLMNTYASLAYFYQKNLTLFDKEDHKEI